MTTIQKRAKDIFIRYGLIGLQIFMIILFYTLEPAFLDIRNIFVILQATATTAIVGLGVTAALSTGDFDLSIGSTASCSMMLSTYMMVVLNMGTFGAVLSTLLFGALVGMANAFLINRMKIPPILTTLGTMFFLLGLQLIPTAGRSISVNMALPNGEIATGEITESFRFLARGMIFDIIPMSVIIMFLVAIIVYFYLERTKWGRILYAIGSNEKATFLAGANVERYKMIAYIISGVLSSLAGVLIAARVGRGDVSSGQSIMLDSIAAALIGYAVFGIGRANPFGTLLGALFVGTLLNGLTMLNMPYYMQDLIKGAMLVLALIFTFSMKQKN